MNNVLSLTRLTNFIVQYMIPSSINLLLQAQHYIVSNVFRLERAIVSRSAQ